MPGPRRAPSTARTAGKRRAIPQRAIEWIVRDDLPDLGHVPQPWTRIMRGGRAT